MAAALVARGPVRSRSTEILCVGSFSIVVDSVDGDVTGGPADDEVFGEDGALPGGGGGGEGDASNASSRGSRTSISKEETDAKLALFRTEAAARLTELERLLDEHDQIIRELKRSESDGGGINYAGVASAPTPATPLDILPITVTPPTTSRTAPTSPASTGPRSAQ
ncbi:uncharacterized protein LOC122248370 [Penaeus japonicus]|uniref:uncharacterized protein LOC122248370 n=1 Tax=Penaeus japonicus TaxID=27405 RepID=UPI001C715FA3|nr:uncharacterized protein LOC122248370 [Penaeus japonicus]